MRVGSLFSGCGGTALGFERAGFEHAWFVEKEPYAQAVLRKRFPEAVVYGDITTIDFTSVPSVDVLEGGFPCQDISNAGKRAGIEGGRSSLWKYYAEAIRVLRPKFVSIENVSALINRGLDVVLADLAALGYDAEWHCFPAAAVGAPHRRDRIFILAYTYGCGEVERGRNCCDEERYAEKEIQERKDEQSRTDCSSQDATNNNSEGLRELQALQRLSVSWRTEPLVGRVAHGIPNRVDRIKCLGNAVVPQAAQAVAEAIKAVVEGGNNT